MATITSLVFRSHALFFGFALESGVYVAQEIREGPQLFGLHQWLVPSPGAGLPRFQRLIQR